MAALASAPAGVSANIQFFLPIANGRIARSAILLSKDATPLVQYCPTHPDVITYSWADKSTSKQSLKMAKKPTRGSPLYPFRSLARSAYIPVINRTPAAAQTSSRLGGSSLLLAGERPPHCGSCQAPLGLLVQLDLATLPETPSWLPASGLLQVFRCTNTNIGAANHACSGQDFKGFTNTKWCRVLPQESIGQLTVIDDSEYSPTYWIQSWIKTDQDYPHPEEEAVESLGASDEAMDEYIDATTDLPHGLDHKYLGWPQFCQGIEYENCPKCNATMKFVFELQSTDDSSLLWFGDEGVCTIQICPHHPDVVTYNWACS